MGSRYLGNATNVVSLITTVRLCPFPTQGCQQPPERNCYYRRDNAGHPIIMRSRYKRLGYSLSYGNRILLINVVCSCYREAFACAKVVYRPRVSPQTRFDAKGRFCWVCSTLELSSILGTASIVSGRMDKAGGKIKDLYFAENYWIARHPSR